MVSKEKQVKAFFDHSEKIEEILNDKELFVFLDYDGTLTPIVDTPDLAILSDEMRAGIEELTKLYKVSIVSGRATDDVKAKVNIDGIYYAGSHGFEILQPNGEVVIHAQAQEFRYTMDEVYAKLFERLKEIKGALVEHVKYTISLHYRLVSHEDFSKFKSIIEKTLAEYKNLKITTGKKVFEVRPQIDWHKGKAVEFILKQFGFRKNKHIAMYLGDDTTDEDVFTTLKDRVVGVLVAEKSHATAADFIVHDTQEVKRVIHYLIERAKRQQ